MKLTVCALALVALTQATDDIDWSKVKPRHVVPVLPDKYFNLPGQKIVGGYEAVPNSIPYQVAIVETSTGQNLYCGGSLISTKYVLTSARCINGATSVQVRLGAHRVVETEDTQVRVTSTSITIHPGYTGDSHLHNIAVVELPSGVELNDNIKPIDLPTWTDAANDYAGYFARMSGWGRDSAEATGISSVLRYVFAEVITNSECHNSFSYITSSHICTNGNGGVGMCKGDTGGPLVADGKQLGVVSSGGSCGSSYPSVFTRVTYYLDWIAQNTDVVISQ